MTGAAPSGIDEIDVQPGSHVCASSGSTDRDRLLAAYLGTGLTAREQMRLYRGLCPQPSGCSRFRAQAVGGSLGWPVGRPA
jgi:hypothetical protein